MRLVVFSLLGKEYALDIKNVIQVVRVREVVSIPGAPDFVEGVIALHGKVIPLVNLRKKLSLGNPLIEKFSRFIILKVNTHNIGIIVDSVTEVINFDSANIVVPDEIFKEAVYLVGVIKLAKRIILFIDAEKLFSQGEKQSIGAVHERVEVRHRE